MKIKILALILIMAMLLSLSACGGSAQKETEPPMGTQTSDMGTATPSDENPETVMFTDSTGREVEIPANITRVAATGTLAQMVIFSLAPDKLVGLSDSWYDSAKSFIDTKYYELPVLGSFYGSSDLNMEEVAAQDPQIIIDIGEAKKSIVEDMDGIMEQVGIPTVHIDASMSTMPEAYRLLGKLLGMEAEAETLAQYCETILSRTNEIAAQAAGAGKVKLLYILGSDGLNVLAKGSFHAEIVDLLSDNLAVVDDPSSKGSGNPVDMEQLLNWDPDVIIFAPDSVYDTAGSDSTWKQLSAISSGRYYKVPEGPYNWMGFPPSINRYMGMIWLSQLLYPEIAEYDLYEETATYYKLFYHSELSREQFNELVKDSVASSTTSP